MAWSAGPLSRSGGGQGEGHDLSGQTRLLTPTLSRTGEGERRVAGGGRSGLRRCHRVHVTRPASRRRRWCR
ncbi:hypothetical protein FV230_25155 [Methylobacterium sp. WL6]|nr:hypothetical protein FV230_25155 [Methylobacterium sp. WL6]